jgi:hypothetical protein
MAVNGTNGAGFRLYAGSTEYGRVYADSSAMILQAVGAVPQLFLVNGSERMRLDAAGNLGLGVTPSPWGVGSLGNIIVPQSGGVVSNGLYANFGTNYYYNAGFKYCANGNAAQYSVGPGTHTWSTAGNNTSGAGATCALTTIMTLDASGNLLVAQTNTPKSGTNTKAVIKNAGIGGFSFSGTSVQDTGISVNAGGNGNTLIFLGSCNFSVGTNTKSAVYIISFYFDGNNTPAVTYVGGAASFLTFGQSATNTLTVTNSTGGNTTVSWFSSAG